MTYDTQTPFEIRRARPDEVEALRSLIVESMGHWDRSSSYLAEATRLMSLNADDVARDEAFVLTVGTEIAAFCRVSVTDRSAEIEELHVRPRWIGQRVWTGHVRAGRAARGPARRRGIAVVDRPKCRGVLRAYGWPIESAPSRRGSPVMIR